MLKNYYRSAGYYSVEISSNLAKIINSEQAELIYSIEEGQKFNIGKISTNVDEVFDKKDIFSIGAKIYKKSEGENYSPFKVKDILDEIDLLIANNNLQFVEHNVQEKIKARHL